MPKKNIVDTSRVKIKQDTKNYRLHSEENKKLISRSLSECGTGRSIVIDSDGEIIAGNGVYEQAIKLGIPIKIVESTGNDLIAVCRTDLKKNDEKRKVLALADNATSDSSKWDSEILMSDWSIGEISEWGIEILQKDIKIKQVSDEYNITGEVTSDSVSGRIYNLGNHRLMCGNANEQSDVDALMGKNRADMVFTDPPFDLENISFMDSLFEYCKHNIFVMNSEQRIVDIAAKHRKSFRRLFCNHFKVNGVIANNQPITMCDYIAEFREEKNKSNFKNLFDCFTTHFEISKIHSLKNEENYGHKQAKRIELPEIFIIHYSSPGQVVLDLFAGAGSTLMACEMNKRTCYCMELDPHNCDIIRKRWAESVHGYGCDWIKITGSK